MNMKGSGGKLTGADVIEQIKKLNPQSQAFLATNEIPEEAQKIVSKSGGDGYLKQPIAENELIGLLKKL